MESHRKDEILSRERGKGKRFMNTEPLENISVLFKAQQLVRYPAWGGGL